MIHGRALGSADLRESSNISRLNNLPGAFSAEDRQRLGVQTAPVAIAFNHRADVIRELFPAVRNRCNFTPLAGKGSRRS